MDLIISRNTKAYAMLFEIECVLRELIRYKLSVEFGQLWHKSNIPGDIRPKMLEGARRERAIKWSKIVPHHPLYYVDFPDLRKIVLQSNNWSRCFCDIFCSKDVIEQLLADLEPMRNKVAHNRVLSEGDINFISASMQRFRAYFQKQLYELLLSKVGIYEPIAQKLSSLRADIVESNALMQNLTKLSQLPPTFLILHEWWIDDDYIGIEFDSVRRFAALLETYINLPRSRGCGHEIESWICESEAAKVADLAIEQLTKAILISEAYDA